MSSGDGIHRRGARIGGPVLRATLQPTPPETTPKVKTAWDNLDPICPGLSRPLSQLQPLCTNALNPLGQLGHPFLSCHRLRGMYGYIQGNTYINLDMPVPPVPRAGELVSKPKTLGQPPGHPPVPAVPMAYLSQSACPKQP
jgi:hypothetical protein